MTSSREHKKPAQGRIALALFLSAVAILALYSAVAGFTTALAFVRGDKRKLEPLTGPIAAFSHLVPAGTGYGYYAPQVCSEFRIKLRLASSRTRQVKDITVNLGPEAALLVSSLNNVTQEKNMIQTIAATYASYGFTRDKSADAAEVRVEAELIPPLSAATFHHSEWVTLARCYFKR